MHWIKQSRTTRKQIRMNSKDRYYNPYKIGKRLYEEGHGISDIIGAVKCDEDMEEAFKGYMDSMKRSESKEIRSKLGYSRIGLGNV